MQQWWLPKREMNVRSRDTDSCRRVTRRVHQRSGCEEGVAADSRPSANALNINAQRKSSCDNRYADYQTYGDVAPERVRLASPCNFTGLAVLAPQKHSRKPPGQES